MKIFNRTSAPEPTAPIVGGQLRGGTRRLNPTRYNVRCSVLAAKIVDALDPVGSRQPRRTPRYAKRG